MTNHPDDRHVLAAAVLTGARAIVPDNVRDFPPEALAPYGLELVSSDDFLIIQYHLDCDGVLPRLEAKAARQDLSLGQFLAAWAISPEAVSQNSS